MRTSLFLAFALLTPAALLAQPVDFPAGAPADAGPARGWTLVAGATYMQPHLSASSRLPFAAAGGLRGGPGFEVAAGYLGAVFGASLGLEASDASVGGVPGGSVGIHVAGHWRPTRTIGRWSPLVTLGYVRQGVGGAELPAGAVSPAARRRLLVPDDTPPAQSLGRVSLLGHGVRTGLHLERRLAPRLALAAGANVDLVQFGKAGTESGDVRWASPGWSTLTRATVGLRVASRR